MVTRSLVQRLGQAASLALPLVILVAVVPRLRSAPTQSLPGPTAVPRATAAPRAASAPHAASGPAHVLTQRNDNRRSGNQLAETTLNVSNVGQASFGKLFSRAVDGEVYAQPLYVAGLKMRGEQRPRNVIFVATQHNSVYAFDADDPARSAPLWHVNLGRSVPSSDIRDPGGVAYQDIKEEIGITSSPVIDLQQQTLWVVAKTKAAGGKVRQLLAALDITSGELRSGGPVEIRARVEGTGIGSTKGWLPFDPLTSNQRASLLLHRGVIYIAWGSHADIQPYHGWVMAYDAKSLRQLGAWTATPDGEGAGIWMSGTGLSADPEGNIYLVTGDGTFSAHNGGDDYGDSFVKLRLTGAGLAVQDWYTPHDEADMNARDKDLGSTGALLSPDGRYIFGGSKLGWLYQLDAAPMGRHQTAADTQIPAAFQVARGSMYGSPLCWEDPRHGLTMFAWCSYDRLKAFRTDPTGRLAAAPASASTVAPGTRPGGFLALSANASIPGTAIVWASHPGPREPGVVRSVPGVLRAFDAADLSHELWNSEQVPGRDRVGEFAKFCVPTIANGKVYVGTFSRQVQVYGLLP